VGRDTGKNGGVWADGDDPPNFVTGRPERIRIYEYRAAVIDSRYKTSGVNDKNGVGGGGLRKIEGGDAGAYRDPEFRDAGDS